MKVGEEEEQRSSYKSVGKNFPLTSVIFIDVFHKDIYRSSSDWPMPVLFGCTQLHSVAYLK
jgi:hypothetical protein